jgi:hypothetical protein
MLLSARAYFSPRLLESVVSFPHLLILLYILNLYLSIIFLKKPKRLQIASLIAHHKLPESIECRCEVDRKEP